MKCKLERLININIIMTEIDFDSLLNEFSQIASNGNYPNVGEFIDMLITLEKQN